MVLTIGVLGGGAWGSTLAGLLAEAGHHVQIWRRCQGSEGLQALEGVELLVGATALVGVKGIAEEMRSWAPRPLLSCSKGLDPASGKTASALWSLSCPQWPLVVLSGPNLASELQQGLPAASVLAGQDDDLLTQLQKELSTEQLRLYRNNDPLGTELAGGLKNVMAIAAGICDGLQLGANARASLLTRALAEMATVLDAMGGCQETLYGLAGIGDLLATATSPLSRNYRFGVYLAEGLNRDDALKRVGATVEGVPTCEAIAALGQQQQWSLPITENVASLLRSELSPTDALSQLMRRELRCE